MGFEMKTSITVAVASVLLNEKEKIVIIIIL